MDVKRYDATVEYGPGWDAGAFAVMDEAADGDWVEFTDYAALRAECDRLRAERDEARTAAELWSQELREAREATAKATQEAETFRHARDLLHDEAEEARDERDTLRAERDRVTALLAKQPGFSRN